MAEAKHTEVTRLILDIDDSTLKKKLAALEGTGATVGGTKSTSSQTTPTPISAAPAVAPGQNPTVAAIIGLPSAIANAVATAAPHAAQTSTSFQTTQAGQSAQGYVQNPMSAILGSIERILSGIANDTSKIASSPGTGATPQPKRKSGGFAGAGAGGVFGGVSIEGTAGVVTGAVGAIVGAGERVANVLNSFVDNFALFNQKSASELVQFRMQQIQARFTLAKAVEPITTSAIKIQEGFLHGITKYSDVINVFSGLIGKAITGLGGFVEELFGSTNDIKRSIAAILEVVGGFAQQMGNLLDSGLYWSIGRNLEDAGHQLLGELPPEQIPGESKESFKKRMDQWKKENPDNLNNPNAKPSGSFKGGSFGGMMIGGVPTAIQQRAQNRKAPPGQNTGGYSGGASTRQSGGVSPPLTRYDTPNNPGEGIPPNFAPIGGKDETDEDYRKRLDRWYDQRDKYIMPDRGQPALPRKSSAELTGAVRASIPESVLNVHQNNSFSIQHEQSMQDGLAAIQNSLMKVLDTSRDESTLALNVIEGGFLARAM